MGVGSSSERGLMAVVSINLFRHFSGVTPS